MTVTAPPAADDVGAVDAAELATVEDDAGGATVATVAVAPQSESEEPFGQHPLSTQ
jgi:hypothetical protein